MILRLNPDAMNGACGMGCIKGSSLRAVCEWGLRCQTRKPEAWGWGMSTVYSKGLACVFVFACTIEILL